MRKNVLRSSLFLLFSKIILKIKYNKLLLPVITNFETNMRLFLTKKNDKSLNRERNDLAK